MITKPLTISGNAAFLEMEVDDYRVIVTIEPPADKTLTERAAKLALTAAADELTRNQLATSGPWK